MDTQRIPLLEGWSIVLPSTFARDVEPDGAVVLWDDSTTIRAVSVATSGRADGSELSAQEMLGDDLGDPQTLPSGNLLVVGKEFQEEIDGEQIWVVPVAAAAPNELLSLYFHSRARGRLGWVAETAATVERLA